MAGTITLDEVRNPGIGGIAAHVFSWTSDASGNVNGTTFNLAGELLRVAFVPGSGGAQPTAAFDVTLIDEWGFDVLNAYGADLRHARVVREGRRGPPRNRVLA